jgi:ribonuclease HI
MTDEQRVYAEQVIPRSFACRQCGYLSGNRRTVEQHLRTDHPQLFADGAGSAAGERTNGRPGAAAGVGDARPSAGAARVEPAPASAEVIFATDAGTWENGSRRQRSVIAVWDSRRNGIVTYEELPGTTNNEAEYAAIIAALELARADGLRGVRVRSDSQLCVNQINGLWQVKEERLRPLRERAARLLRDVGGTIEWVPRGRNPAGIFLEKQHKPR